MAPSWLRSRRRWAAIGAGGLALYAIVGFFVVPRVVRSEIVKLARTELHREAHVARVRFNPFTLACELEGIELKDRDGAPLFRAERIDVNLQFSGIFRRAWRLGDFEIDTPSIEARILGDGKPSVADLFESTPGEEAKPRKAGPPRLIVDHLKLRNGRVEFVDESRSPRFVQTLEPLNLEMHDLITLPDETGDHAVTIGLGAGASLHWAGKQTIEPLRLEGRLEITGISLERIGDYAAADVPWSVLSGTAGVGLAYDVRRAGDGTLSADVKDASVTLQDLTVGPRDRSERWLEVPSVVATGIAAAWPAARVDAASIRIADPKVLVRRDETGALNWTGALPPPRAPGPPAADAGRPWTAAVAGVEVSGGEVTFDDRAVSPGVTTVLSALGVTLIGLSTDPVSSVKADLSGTIDGEGRLTASGSIVPRGPSAGFDVALSDLDLVPFQPYVAALPGAQIRAGRAGMKGRLEISPANPRVRFDGTASIDAFQVAGAGEDRLVAWDRAQAGGLRATIAPDRLRVTEVRVDGAFLKLRIDRDGNVNVSRLGRAQDADGSTAGASVPGPAASSPATPATSTFPLEIGKIVIVDADADYTDESLILPFGTKIHALNGDIRDISTTAASPARLAVEGRVAEEGYVKANGTLRVADPLAAVDVGVNFRNVSMPELTPYVAQFAGYSVRSGVLDVDVRYHVRDRHLVGEHHVVAKDLVLGPKVEGAKGSGIPVRLAIALLKDKDGRIDLQVPVEGTVDSPEFNYRSVLWRAFKAILSDVAKAPFRAIGRLFGADKEDLDLVGFPAGRADLPAPEQETLKKLAAELSKRAELSLAIEGRFDPVADAAALRRARLEARIDAKRTPDASLDAILAALYVETFSNEQLEAKRQEFVARPPGAPSEAQPTFDAPAFYESVRTQLQGAVPVSAGDLADLARSRAAAIQAALTAPGGLDPARVTLGDPAPVKRRKGGSDLVASEMTLTAKD
jgi:uncharacterized protein involved in outer membrane biogenesis